MGSPNRLKEKGYVGRISRGLLNFRDPGMVSIPTGVAKTAGRSPGSVIKIYATDMRAFNKAHFFK